MSEHNALYQRALYYDIAMRRDMSGQIEFLVEAFRRHAGRDPQSAIDLACGPGYYAMGLARHGLHTYGLDIIPEMVQLARDKAEAQGLQVHWLVGDMCDYTLDQPVDLTVCMYDSFDGLTRNADIVRHFKTVARNLNPDGIYVIDFSHPRSVNMSDYRVHHYVGDEAGVHVEIFWGSNTPLADIVTGIAKTEMEIHVTQNGTTEIIHDSASERVFFPQEISLLADLSGELQLEACYGAYDVNQPLDYSESAHRMVVVLRKR